MYNILCKVVNCFKDCSIKKDTQKLVYTSEETLKESFLHLRFGPIQNTGSHVLENTLTSSFIQRNKIVCSFISNDDEKKFRETIFKAVPYQSNQTLYLIMLRTFNTFY